MAASSLQSSGRSTNFWVSSSMACMTLAGAGRPTISNAPAAWCNCWRAMRSWLPSSSAKFEPRARSASRTKRRIALVAPSSDFFSSSRTQARGPRSLSSSSMSPVAAAFVCMGIRIPEVVVSGRWRQAVFKSGDLEPRHRLAQLVGHPGQLTHLRCGGTGAFARLLGHRKNMLDVVGHHVGQFGFT